MLERLKQQNITILVSTPYMDEASRCDRIALIREGSILSVDTPFNIRKKFNHPLLAVKADKMYPLLKTLRAYPDTAMCFSYGDAHHLTLKRAIADRNEEQLINNEVLQLKKYLIQNGYEHISIQSIEPTIEDCFMLL